MAKKKEMNRTSGTAKRKVDTAGKLLTSKEVGTAVKKGAPLTGSASGVKSISLKQAGEVLTQGIVTLGKKGLQMDPAGLAMALPIGKLGRAAKALSAAGKAGDVAKAVGAQSIGNRLASKALGEGAGKSKFLQQAGKVARSKSEKVFPRLDAARSGKFRGMTSQEFTAMAGRKADIPMALKRELSEAVKNSTTGFTKFSKGAARKGETVTRGVGTVNAKGYAKLQKMQDPIVRFYTAAERGIKRKGK